MLSRDILNANQSIFEIAKLKAYANWRGLQACQAGEYSQGGLD